MSGEFRSQNSEDRKLETILQSVLICEICGENTVDGEQLLIERR